MEERLQKILSRAGFGSRRDCETFIEEQRVTVNGQVAVLGTKVDPETDSIRVDGVLLRYEEPEKVYIAVNKPRFVLSDRAEDDARQTVYDLVPNSESLFVVGRLDFESEGLVLLTNDGDLANKLTHPRFEQEKEYKVLVAKRPDNRQLEAWSRGVILDDGEKTAPAKVTIIRPQGEGAWLRVMMREGRKRQIREICRTIGLPVVKLIRVRIGTLLLGQLQSREWAYLKPEEVKALKDLVAGKPISIGKSAVRSRPEARRSGYKTGGASRRPIGATGRRPFRNTDPHDPERGERTGYAGNRDRKPYRDSDPHSPDRSERGGYGDNRERKPYRDSDPHSPERGERGGYGSNRERKPYRDSDPHSPDRGERGGYGSNRDRKPYRDSDPHSPDRGERGGYGSNRERKPYRDSDPHSPDRGERGGYGGNRERKPYRDSDPHSPKRGERGGFSGNRDRKPYRDSDPHSPNRGGGGFKPRTGRPYSGKRDDHNKED